MRYAIGGVPQEEPKEAQTLRLRCPTWAHFDQLYTGNVRRGHMFLPRRPDSPLPGPLVIYVALPTGDELRIPARVLGVDGSDPELDRLKIVFDSRDDADELRRDETIRKARASTPASFDGAPLSNRGQRTMSTSTLSARASERAPVSDGGAQREAERSRREAELAKQREAEQVAQAELAKRREAEQVAQAELAKQREAALAKQRETEILVRLRGDLARVQSASDFDALGVGEGTTGEPLRVAYLQQCRFFHPDRFARYPSQEIQDLAHDVFVRIESAYRKLGRGPVLRDPSISVSADAGAATRRPFDESLPSRDPHVPPVVTKSTGNHEGAASGPRPGEPTSSRSPKSVPQPEGAQGTQLPPARGATMNSLPGRILKPTPPIEKPVMPPPQSQRSATFDQINLAPRPVQTTPTANPITSPKLPIVRPPGDAVAQSAERRIPFARGLMVPSDTQTKPAAPEPPRPVPVGPERGSGARVSGQHAAPAADDPDREAAQARARQLWTQAQKEMDDRRSEEAIATLEKILRLDPHHPFASVALRALKSKEGDEVSISRLFGRVFGLKK